MKDISYKQQTGKTGGSRPCCGWPRSAVIRMESGRAPLADTENASKTGAAPGNHTYLNVNFGQTTFIQWPALQVLQFCFIRATEAVACRPSWIGAAGPQ
ncbi:hypothetical protein V8Z74_03540 [Comamonas sp. w2-DMI]|uniref:Uncharacterized protein n=1 Tax=Comamonas terrae TaxID=673548 RepID=A0ABW5ULT8_9BURK|nr:hypothetical protein [Comamonas terrae]